MIKIISPNGQQLDLNLNNPELTYSGLQDWIYAEFGIPPKYQRITVGFPPKLLQASLDNEEQVLPLKNGDRLTVENCPRPKNESSTQDTHSLFNCLFLTPDKFASIQSDGDISIENEMRWSVAKLTPVQFLKGGFVYEEIASTTILIDMHHMCIDTFPNKTFAYNSTFDCIELCVESLGHFIISKDLESKMKQAQKGYLVGGFRKCTGRTYKEK